MVQWIGQLKDNSVGGSIAQGLQGLMAGGLKGYELGVEDRAQRSLEEYRTQQTEIDKGNQEIAQHAQELRQKEIDERGRAAFIQLPPAQRAKMFDYFAQHFIPGVPKGSEGYEASRVMLSKDETAVPYSEFLSRMIGDPSTQQTFMTMVRNGHVSEAFQLAGHYVEQARKAEGDKAEAEYKQADLDLRKSKQVEERRHNRETEGQPSYGQPIDLGNGQFGMWNKKAQRMDLIDPSTGRVQGESATTGQTQVAAPTTSSKQPSAQDVANYKRTIEAAPDRKAEVDDYLKSQGYDPSAFGGAAPAGKSEAKGPYGPAPKSNVTPATQSKASDLTQSIDNLSAGLDNFEGMMTGEDAPNRFQRAAAGVTGIGVKIPGTSTEIQLPLIAGLGKGPKVAAVEGAYKNLLIQIKDLAGLGALTGPDMGVIEGILADPTGIVGGFMSTEAILKQVGELRKVLATKRTSMQKVLEGGTGQ